MIIHYYNIRDKYIYINRFYFTFNIVAHYNTVIIRKIKRTKEEKMNTLIVYFSWSGNTEKIAKNIARNADIRRGLFNKEIKKLDNYLL